MPCNSKTCDNFTPTGDGSGETCANPCGVTVEKKIWPVWDTKRINVPDWYRDRVMYYYDDVCERAQVHTANGTSPTIPPDSSGDQVEYGLSGVENPNAGRVRKALQSGYWWQGNGILCPPVIYRGSLGTAGASSPCRYWDHYPTEQSFEPVRSDTWFSYLYDTSSGVTGKPCFVYCYYTYTLSGTSSNGKGTTTSYNTYYGIRKVPYTCNCDPKETYVNYTLEDGKITEDSETDPYPLIWTVGTKQERIAFTYPTGGQIAVKNVTTTSAEVRMVKSAGNFPVCGGSFAGTKGQVGVGTTANADWGQTYYDWSTIFNASGPVAVVPGPNLPGSGFELSTTTGGASVLGGAYTDTNHRYTTDVLIQERGIPGNDYQFDARKRKNFGYINATLRYSNNGPFGSFIKFGTIKGGDNQPVDGEIYELWVRMANCPKNIWKIGQIKFTSITTTPVAPTVPTTFHMGEPIAVSGSTGTNLNTMGFYEVWNGGRSNSYMSSQGGYWKSRNAKAIQDYSLPNGTIIRCEISSYYDNAAAKYYTRWKIIEVIKYGNGYNTGDGTVYSNQNVYYLYYPSLTDPNRVGVALMVSGTSDGDWSQGSRKLTIGDTVNGWTVTKVKQSDDEFNMHVAHITGGSNNFTKDTNYTSASGVVVNVKAGWGIKDRAALIGRYEFQRKEIVYVTAKANEDVPQEDLDVVKPQLQAVVQNGKVTEIQVLKPGSGLSDPFLEPIKIAIQEPPGYINRDAYLELITSGVDPADAYEQAKGSSKKAYAEPVILDGRLQSVKIINGGSGYSSTNPPGVAVPYIARKFTTVDKFATTAKEQEPGAAEMFERSEAYKLLAKAPIQYDQYSWDEKAPTSVQTPITDISGEFTGSYKFDITKAKKTTVKQDGFDFTDYSKLQETQYSEKTTSQLKGSIKELERKKNSQIYVRPKGGMSKEAAQAFLPPANKDHVSTKTNDYQKLLNSADTTSKTNSDYFKSFSTAQQNLIDGGSLDPNTSKLVYDGLSSEQASQVKNLPRTVSKNAKVPSSDPVRPSDPTSNLYLDQASMLKIATNNLDDGNYYNKEFKNFYKENKFVSGSTAATFDAILNDIDKKYEDNVNGIWQMDLDENRTIVYDGAARKIAKAGFFNLPCSTRTTRYVVQSYCPDPRKNTFMNVIVGVKVMGKDTENQRGPCTKCLYDNATVLAAYNSLKNQWGSDNVDIADAYCSTYVFTTNYSGQVDGVARGIPFGSYSLPYSSTLFGGYARSFIKTQFENQRVYEGCKDYTFSGNLEILHDRTLETQVFVNAIRRYGNPYNSICSTTYEDNPSIEESLINNITAASTETQSNAVAQLPNPISYSE